MTKDSKVTHVLESIKSEENITDSMFDLQYSVDIREASEMHFTPIEVAKVASNYLVDNAETRVLDIGSGAGKFCLIGANGTDAQFVGVELRGHFCLAAIELAQKCGIDNVKFIHSNITDVPFHDFDAFYFYNAFFESLHPSGRIDHNPEVRKELFDKYSTYVKSQLDKKPIGTKLVTYFSYLKEIPSSYRLQESHFDAKLKFWKKVE